MNILIGLNKDFAMWNLGVKLARTLSPMGYLCSFVSENGPKYFHGELAVKNYSSLTRVKTLASYFSKNNTKLVISFMNTKVCEAALEAQIPYVYIEDESCRTAKRFSKLEKTILSKASQVLVLHSEGDAKFASKYLGFGVQAMVYPAVVTERNEGNMPECFKKQNNILAIGSFAKENNFAVLLNSWWKLAPLHPSWHLTLVGDGSEKNIYQKFISKNALTESTEIVSLDTDVEPLVGKADVFAFVGEESNQKAILLNAMASKLPCVVFDNKLAKNLVLDGVNGLLVDTQDDFTNALDALMVDWAKRVGFAVEASKLKERYSFDNFVNAILNVAHTLVK